MDIAEKVEALKDWLANRMGAEVGAGFDPLAEICAAPALREKR